MMIKSIQRYNNDNKNRRSNLNFGSIYFKQSDFLAKEIKAAIPILKKEAKGLCMELSCTNEGSHPYIVAEAYTPNSIRTHLKKIKYVYKLAVSKDIEPEMTSESKIDLIINTAKDVLDQYNKGLKTERYASERSEDVISTICYKINDFFKNHKNH